MESELCICLIVYFSRQPFVMSPLMSTDRLLNHLKNLDFMNVTKPWILESECSNIPAAFRMVFSFTVANKN